MKRGEVWLVGLDPTVGSEIQKTRPCVVVSPDEMNDHLRTAVVVPMTTGSRPTPFRVPISFRKRAGLLLADQMRTVDRARLVTKLGRVDTATLQALLNVLREMFGE